MALAGESVGSSCALRVDEAVLNSDKRPKLQEPPLGGEFPVSQTTPEAERAAGSEGGVGRDVQNAPSPGSGKGWECYGCGEEGHWKKDCPNKWKRFETRSPPGTSGAYFGRAMDAGGFPVVQCPCGKGPCIILMSRTEKNPGRYFYRCPAKFSAGQCGYFQWCDSVVPGKPGKPKEFNSPVKEDQQPKEFNSPVIENRLNVLYNPRTPNKIGFRSPAKFNGQHDLANSSHPMCSCGAGRSIILTKDVGDDVQRRYFACPIRKGCGACNFFQWLDPMPTHNNSPQNAVQKDLPTFSLVPEEPKEPGVVDIGASKANATTQSPPKVSDCFVCEQEGHWMRDCKGSPRSPCFKCGKVGHWKNDCIS